MKAIQVRAFGGPEVMKLEESPEPTVNAGQLLIEVKAAGVNPVDTTFRSGKHPLSKGLKLPWTPGFDAAGVVIGIGEGVKGFKVGDRVFGLSQSGSYAEKAALNANRTAHLPNNYAFSEGASLPIVLYTAYYTVVYEAGMRPGETLLVQGGAGGVGSLAIQIGKLCGAKVITTVSSKEKADFCRQLGADVVINYREQDVVKICLDETQGRGVDAIIEPVAAENFQQDCDALKKFGRLVLIGAGTGKEPEGKVNFPALYSKNIRIHALSIFNVDKEFPEMLLHLFQLLKEKKIKAVVGKTLSLAQAASAHELLIKGNTFGKIILEIK